MSRKRNNRKSDQQAKTTIIAAILIVIALVLNQLGIVDLSSLLGGGKRIPPNAKPKEVLTSLQSKQLVYTEHARCRMNCRHISKSEVQDILRNGEINYRKSVLDDRPCPTYAIEGMTKDNQEVRIVFANCDYKAKVITTIDLRNKYDCYCK